MRKGQALEPDSMSNETCIMSTSEVPATARNEEKVVRGKNKTATGELGQVI